MIASELKFYVQKVINECAQPILTSQRLLLALRILWRAKRRNLV